MSQETTTAPNMIPPAHRARRRRARWMTAIVLGACLLGLALAGSGRADTTVHPSRGKSAEEKLEEPPPPAAEDGLSSESPGLLERLSPRSLRAAMEKSTLIPIFRKGGPIMWPLLVASILSMGTVIDRPFFLIGVRSRRDTRAMARFFEAVTKGDIDEAVRVSERSKYYVVRTLGFALSNRDKSLVNALICAQQNEMERFRRGIPILDTIITLAPLLGLLGTVTGMMGSFSLIGGELSAPGAVTGGIAEALIATAYGLGIAITSLLPFNYLNARMEEARLELESAATQLELLMIPRERAARAGAPIPGRGKGGTAGPNDHTRAQGIKARASVPISPPEGTSA